MPAVVEVFVALLRCGFLGKFREAQLDEGFVCFQGASPPICGNEKPPVVGAVSINNTSIGLLLLQVLSLDFFRRAEFTVECICYRQRKHIELKSRFFIVFIV